jgi:hypothetical protein
MLKNTKKRKKKNKMQWRMEDVYLKKRKKKSTEGVERDGGWGIREKKGKGEGRDEEGAKHTYIQTSMAQKA